MCKQLNAYVSSRIATVNVASLIKPCKFLQHNLGMSADFEAAIAQGATIICLGTAVFGKRANKLFAILLKIIVCSLIEKKPQVIHILANGLFRLSNKSSHKNLTYIKIVKCCLIYPGEIKNA